MATSAHGDHLLQITRLRTINVYLVREDDGLTLVDAGIGGSAKAILAAARETGQAIQRIVITHAHPDHVGSLDALKKELPGVEVCISARDAKLLEGDASPQEGETKKVKAVGKAKTRPDRLLAPGDRVGSLEVHDAKGHSPGQLAFSDTRDGTLLCGDAFFTIGGTAKATDGPKAPFPLPGIATHDRAQAKATGERLRALKPARLAPGHGKVLDRPFG